MAFTFNSMKVNVTSFTFTWQIRQWSISKFRKGHVKKKYFNKTAIVLYLIHFWYLIHRIKERVVYTCMSFMKDISLLSICFMDFIFLVRSFNVNGTFMEFFLILNYFLFVLVSYSRFYHSYIHQSSLRCSIPLWF